MRTLREAVIAILGEAEEPMSVGEVIDIIRQERDVARQTLNAQMIRMMDDGLLCRIDSVPQRYSLPKGHTFGKSQRINLFDLCLRQAGHL